MPKVKIKKGDQVVVLTGKDKGKKGEVLKVLPKENRAVVQGVNTIKRHTKPTQSQAGGIVEREASIHISNLAFVDPKTGEPTRIGYKFLDDNRKVRVARRSGEVIDA
ncbi:50S ribosomal protein L24 [Shumkonia mesophila]|uniref:50S ribosomal protein L24 n=1 Tax=Shumkonia mesophila TaxID=2838854 RepID=UPI002934FD0F|nr:50S ribosomal protein L24 [Shumkonia mesophila]